MAAKTNDGGFAELFAANAAALHAWAVLQVRGLLAGTLEPEDLVQEIGYQALRGFDRFDREHGSFRPWLFGVANNVTKSFLRRAVREYGSAGAIEGLASRAGSVPAELTTISRRVARDEALERFLADVERDLDEDDHALLLYRGLEGLPHAEVGALLGVGEETARKRWLRLRERLKTGAVEGLLAPL